MDAVRSDYLHTIFDPEQFSNTVTRAKRMAWRLLEVHQFDFIVFTGNSGAVVAGIIADALNVPLTCVRKRHDNSHFTNSGGLVEGWLGGARYLFVDDFICTGETFRRTWRSMNHEVPDADCVAILLYACSRGRTQYDGIPLYSSWKDDECDIQMKFPSRDGRWNEWNLP